jgi:hypothetical protein
VEKLFIIIRNILFYFEGVPLSLDLAIHLIASCSHSLRILMIGQVLGPHDLSQIEFATTCLLLEFFRLVLLMKGEIVNDHVIDNVRRIFVASFRRKQPTEAWMP